MRRKLILSACLLLAGSLAPAARQATPPPAAPTIRDAQARLQANDPAGAAKILETITAATPSDPRAWTLLGTASQRAKDPARAIAAYTRALDLQPQNAQLLYNLGSAHAQTQDVEQAFAWLSKARATRRVDMTQMEGDANLGPLRREARYLQLRPTDADFRDPFVEPVEILREWQGETPNEQFGWIARNIGDVDRDRVADFVTSAPTKSIGGANAGRIYVYSTGTGSLLWSADGQPGDQFGLGVEAAGDTNGDGTADVIASAPGGGYARVLSGRDGKLLLTLRAEDRADVYGRHVAGAGDVNRDGHADVLVGAPGHDAGGDGAGRTYLYSGKDGTALMTWNGERAGDAFGSAVSGATDARASLILIGAPTAGPRNRGRTYVYDGMAAQPKFVIEAGDTGAAMGAMFVSVPGDVDGDGIMDAFASDFGDTARGPSTGRTVVHSGRDGRQLLSLTGETAGEGFGTSTSIAGDVNGDGHADLIVGAWQYGAAATSAGRAYLHSGKDGTLLKTYTCRTPGDTFGFDANEIGDINADGMIDFLITSAWSGVRGFHSGRVFVISSGIRRQR